MALKITTKIRKLYEREKLKDGDADNPTHSEGIKIYIFFWLKRRARGI